MGFIWALIVGGVIGAIAGAITKKGSLMGIIANIIAGLVGSTIGQAILGTWGTKLSWDGYCAIDYRGSDFSCHRFMDFRTKIEKV